jgi:hypothetical protein
MTMSSLIAGLQRGVDGIIRWLIIGLMSVMTVVVF